MIKLFNSFSILNILISKNSSNLLNSNSVKFSSIPNFSELNELPKNVESKNSKIQSNFVSEKITIRELDYYYTNSISRSSKTMSECRQIRQKIKKDGTNN